MNVPRVTPSALQTSPRFQSAKDFAQTYWQSAARSEGSLPELTAETIGDADFRRLADNVPTLCWIANGNGYIVWYNRRWHEYCGTSPAQMEGWRWQSVHDPELLPGVLAKWTASIGSGQPFEMVFPLRGADGLFRPFLTRISPLKDATGRVVRWFGVNVEISAQVAAEAALDQSEAKYEAIANSIDQMVWSTLPDGFHDYYNQRWYDFTGVPQGSTDGEAWNGMFHADDQERAWATWRHCLAKGEPYHIEYRLKHRSGLYRWVVGRAHCVRDDEGAITRWFGTCTDIQELVDAREVLARSREELERLVVSRTSERDRIWRNSRDILVEIGADGIFHEVSPAWTTILGHAPSEVAGHHFHEFVVEEDNAATQNALERAAVPDDLISIENRYRHKDGGFRWISWRTSEENGVVFASGRDITSEKEAEAELERAQEALRQSQKMEAVGQLTGGIAHDFNNLLTIVTGNIDMASRALDAASVTDARTRRALDNAMKGAERAAALTQRLLAFSRRQPLAPKPLDADKLVVGMSDMLQRALGETVELEIVTSPGLWRVEADPNQLEAALLNLAVNARDAMPDGGTLAIESLNARLDEGYAAQHAEVAPGDYAVIAVTDTGHGMSSATLARVFEPFFTTKEVGKGTGLGLSMVYGFVKQSGGHLKIYSEEGRGTSVKIYLPRILGEASDEPEPSAAADLEISRRRETILCVEDDDDVRAYTVECLRELGYRVLEAHDGASALRLMERQEQPLDLLFTDVVMPRMSGAELAQALRRRHPSLKVLYTSGYTRNAIVHGGRLDPGVEMIAKPFTFAALSAKVRDVIDQGQTGRLLLVEHEPTVRALTVEALAHSPYKVDQAANGTEALAKIRAAQGRYDVVLIDQALADRAGDALALEIRALYADMPLLLATDAGSEDLRSRFAEDRRIEVIDKPYTAAQLTDRLRGFRG